jgi:hypothetical protein
MLLRAGRVLADQMRREFLDCRFDTADGAVQRCLAPSDDAVIGGDAHQQPVAPVDPVFEGFYLGDFHVR